MRQILRKTMTKLSVNINKVATLRNARGGDTPNVVKVALDCEAFGADGITVHPRPNGRRSYTSAGQMYMICVRCCGPNSISRATRRRSL